MKNNRGIMMLGFLVGLMTLSMFTATSVYADLAISDYTIDATVKKNGDVDFVEQITFQADSRYKGIFYNLDISEVTVPTDVSVSLFADGQEQVLQQSTNGEYNSYEIAQTNKLLSFKIYHPFEDTSITIKFNYSIPSFIVNYLDTAEFNRKVVGTSWEIDQANIRFTLHLPEGADRDSLRAWGHGPQEGVVKIAENYSSVTMTVPKNQSGDFVEAHVIFPTSLTPYNVNTVNRNAKEEIIAQEESLIVKKEEDAAAVAKQIETFKWISLLGIIPLGLNALLAYVKGWKANQERLVKVPYVPDHLYEIPEDITPAVMTRAIYDKSPTETDISATVMDLVRKGALSMSDHEPYTLTVTNKPVALARHELYLMNFLIGTAGDGKKLVLDDLEGYAKTHSSAYVSHINQWKQLVEIKAKAYTSSEEGVVEHNKLAVFSVFASIALIVFFLVMIFLTRFSLQSILVFVLALVVVVFSLRYSGIFTKQRTVEGEYRFRQWQAFKQMLLDISNIDLAEVPSIIIWDHILVYAISLGVADKVIKVLNRLIPDLIKESVFYSDVSGWQMTYYYHALNSNLTSAYSKADAIVNPPNSGGYGGGFSGGSSGGSGGGSGGGGF